MEIISAQKLALSLMQKHGLNDWTFEFDRASIRFGLCSWKRKRISLSLNMVAANSEAEVKETILHEIAHALAGKAAGHGLPWMIKCIEIGCKPTRCYDENVKNAARGWK